MNDVGDANSFTFQHCLRRSEREAERNLNERGSFSSWLWLKTSQRLGKGGGQRARGSVYEKGEKRLIIWGVFARRRRWLPAHVWTLF